MEIHYFPQDLVLQNAAEFLINWLKLYHNIHQKTLFLLSGGSVIKIYSDLGRFINTSELNFDFLAFAQIDERFKPANKEDINAVAIGKTGLWEICKKKNILYYLISQQKTLEKSAEEYNQTISKLFKEYQYKIAVLGIGEDAHTAGLIPGFENYWNVEKYVVGYDLGQNNPRGLSGQQEFKQRITITPYALIQLDQAIVVAVGEKKKEAIAKINDMKIKDMDKYPAVILQKIKKVDLFTDQNLTH